MDEDNVKRQAMLKLYEELQQIEKEQLEGAKWYTVEELEMELLTAMEEWESLEQQLSELKES